MPLVNNNFRNSIFLFAKSAKILFVEITEFKQNIHSIFYNYPFEVKEEKTLILHIIFYIRRQQYEKKKFKKI